MIDSFYEWYNALTTTMQVYWAIALITSLFFLVQMVLTFIGIGDVDTDFDADFEFVDGDTLDFGGSMQLFTVRNLINFLLGLGWGGVCWYSICPNPLLQAVLALLTGFVFVYAFLIVYRQMLKLERNGAYHIDDCVGKVVDVYLTIPAERAGSGKVQVSFNGSVQELSAITNNATPLRSGTKVRVVELVDKSTVLVEAL